MAKYELKARQLSPKAIMKKPGKASSFDYALKLKKVK